MTEEVKKEQVMCIFHLSDEPNEAKLNVFHFDDNHIDVKAFSGFTAMDIYNLLVKGETNESC